MNIFKCDRCGETVSHLTKITTSIPVEQAYQEKKQENYHPMSSFFPVMFSTANTISLEICDDCLKILIRWMSHSENYLMKMQELAKKG